MDGSTPSRCRLWSRHVATAMMTGPEGGEDQMKRQETMRNSVRRATPSLPASLLTVLQVPLALLMCTAAAFFWSATAEAVTAGPEIQVNTFSTADQWAAVSGMDSNGNFVVAWQSFGQDGFGYGVFAQRYNAAGAQVGSEFKVNTFVTNNQSAPAVAMSSGGSFVVAWQSVGSFGTDTSGSAIAAQHYDAAGVEVGSEFQVNTYTTSEQTDPTVAIDDGGDFVVAWQSLDQDGSGYGVFARQFFAEPPTALAVSSLAASRTRSGIVLRWRTSSEIDTLGFNVYRRQNGELVKLNRAPIRSVFGGTATGYAYSWLDRSAPRGAASYRLQAVNLSGKRSWVGATTVIPLRRL